MARLLSLLCAALLACLVTAIPASALVLPFEARLTFEFGNMPPVGFPSSGFATLNGSGGGGALASLDLAAGVLGGGPVLVPITDPATAPLMGLLGTVANGAGHFAAGAGVMGGAMPLPGRFRICLFTPCASALANLSVPLSAVGEGGARTVMAAVNLTVYGAPWTAATVAIGTVTRMGFAMGPDSATGSTAQPGGQLQLVTPIYLSTNIGASVVLPAFAILTLHFVPEPATLALLASGIMGLAWAGTRRL